MLKISRPLRFALNFDATIGLNASLLPKRLKSIPGVVRFGNEWICGTLLPGLRIQKRAEIKVAKAIRFSGKSLILAVFEIAVVPVSGLSFAIEVI